MPAEFTRAAHPDLPPAVLPAAAVQAFPGWQAYGEPSTDPDALWALIAAEAEAAATVPPKTSRGAASPPPAEPPAPAGASPKE